MVVAWESVRGPGLIVVGCLQPFPANRNCKARKVKCGEEKPRCSNCERLDEECDYKIRLSWGGRPLKKKQLENGGQGGSSGTDPNADDQSQFIPGAGQFSINSAHFPAPQTFVQTSAPTNGAARKPPVPRVGGGKKSNMSTYQTVFAVGEVPQQSPPTLPTTTAPPATGIPTSQAQHDAQQLNILIPTASQPQSPTGPQHGSQSAGPSRSGSFGWPQDGTSPATMSTVTTPHYDPLRNDQHDHRAQYYTPYTPSTSNYTPTLISPPISDVRYQSSPAHSSPDHGFSHPLSSPPGRNHKNYHPPPLTLNSPTKKQKQQSTTSPTNPPPNSPFIHGRYASSSGPAMATASLAGAMDEIYNNSAPMGLPHLHMDSSGIGLGGGSDMRRLSVGDLLIAPSNMQPDYIPSFSERYGSNIETFKTEDNGPQYDINGQLMDDDDVEEIPRYDLSTTYNNNSNAELINPRPFFQVSRPSYTSPMSIPRRLDPLPQLLLGNPKNMMYFHHYLHFTARLLVPHDCSENPFKHILPQMAVKTDHLMNLLLAYSASHRARLLDRPEPTERIGSFIDETVRSLNVALNHREDATSDASLATAIMLASYQIVSPDPYAQCGVTWRDHLEAARRIIVSRGGAQGMHSGEQVSYFLVRWFAYLDLVGRLSGREIDEPIFSGKYWTTDNEAEEDEHSVNCFFGFTTRCVSILANICELARKVEADKKMPYRILSSNAAHNSEYTLPQDILMRAEEIRAELIDSRDKSVGKCGHDTDHAHLAPTPSSIYPEDFDQNELLAVNDAFHWAAEIQLYRRVLGYPSHHPDVQRAVGLIVCEMYKIKHGGTAENCLLFPLFTAGCEATDYDNQNYALDRMKLIEKTGLTQVSRHDPPTDL